MYLATGSMRFGRRQEGRQQACLTNDALVIADVGEALGLRNHRRDQAIAKASALGIVQRHSQKTPRRIRILGQRNCFRRPHPRAHACRFGVRTGGREAQKADHDQGANPHCAERL